MWIDFVDILERIMIQLIPLSTCAAVLRIAYNSGVLMGAMPSQITRLTIVYSTFYSGADQRKHQSSASLPIIQ